MHNGVDIRVDSDVVDPVIQSIGDGIVEHASPNDPTSNYDPYRANGAGFSGYGRVVAIRHANGLRSFYAHLDRTLVQTGQPVTKGQAIGIMGKTEGRRDAPNKTFDVSRRHLHFEVSPRPYPQSPYKDRANPVHVLRWGPDFFLSFPAEKMRCLYGRRTK